jgi:hypothetical protein
MYYSHCSPMEGLMQGVVGSSLLGQWHKSLWYNPTTMKCINNKLVYHQDDK